MSDEEIGTEFSLLESLLAVGADLRRRDVPTRVESELAKPVPQVTVGAIAPSLGHPISAALMSFYELSDGMRLVWSAEDGAGSIAICDFARVFGYWFDAIWDRVVSSELDVWTLRGFDMPAREGAVDVAIRFADGAEELFALCGCAAPRALELDPVDYLYIAVAARGLHGWQWLFAPDRPDTFSARGWLERFEALFPKADHAFFRAFVA